MTAGNDRNTDIAELRKWPNYGNGRTMEMAEVRQQRSDFFFIAYPLQSVSSLKTSMGSHKNLVDDARRLQDDRIKTDCNFFVTWDQWVPPKLCTSPSPQNGSKLTNYILSNMPSWQTQTEALPTQHAGTERFDMSWNFEDDQVPTVERPNDTPSADPHVLSQVFDMCWDTEVNPAATGPAEAAVPLKSGEYNLCWNAEKGLPKVDVALIHQLDIQENETIAIAIPGGAGQYDMCWNDRASAEAMEFMGDFDMCWGDSALAGDDHLESGSIAAPVINLINAADTPATYDLCFENISPATSLAPRDGSPSQTVEAGEELLRRANSRLENINAAMRDDRREGCKDLLDANQDLIADYQHARDQFVAASDDVAKLQHLMNMHREIDDPLHILLLAMRKMGRGHSPIQ
ncbi:hypothetical protein C8R48DRAFT_780123 [Suillus tomentosus]|nr:hypothetical protein C8R48DRAFT_780123 [Suillus tomentosus]